MATSSALMYGRLKMLLDQDDFPISLPDSQESTTQSPINTTHNDIKDFANCSLSDQFENVKIVSGRISSPMTEIPCSMSNHSEKDQLAISESPSNHQWFPVTTSSLIDKSSHPALCVGKLADEKESFCPVMVISKFPYKFVHDKELAERISEAFFTEGKFWRLDWYIYYMWAPNSSATKPLLLVRLRDAEKFIQRINEQIGEACLSIQNTAEFEPGILLTFDYSHPSLRPRYLGHSFSQEQFSDISRNCHGNSYRLPEEIPARLESKIDKQDLKFCKTKVELGLDLCRSRVASKAARQQVRLRKQQNWRQDLRQVERFLGLRPQSYRDDTSHHTIMSWDDCKAIEEKVSVSKNPAAINPDHYAPYGCESDVVFISIDIECYERDKRQVTEIGVSTLDTRDLTNIIPGPHGAGWFSKIRSRHFRIRDHMHLVNRSFVKGCPDDFRFGQSEFIQLDDAPRALATCFRPPYSSSPENHQVMNEEKRTIVLVGHDFANDLRYMQRLGYDVTNLSNLHPHNPIADTQGLYRALSQLWEPVKLGAILDEAEIAPFGLHNAGNDAAYTMQAMLAIAVKSAGERGSKAAQKRRRAANRLRIAEQARLAILRAFEELDGWSTPDDGEEDCCVVVDD